MLAKCTIRNFKYHPSKIFYIILKLLTSNMSSIEISFFSKNAGPHKMNITSMCTHHQKQEGRRF